VVESKQTLRIEMRGNVMISRKAKKPVPATEQLQPLTPAELTEVSGGCGGGGGYGGYGYGDSYGGYGDGYGGGYWHHRCHRRGNFIVVRVGSPC
jgi:hypothetical protein